MRCDGLSSPPADWIDGSWGEGDGEGEEGQAAGRGRALAEGGESGFGPGSLVGREETEAAVGGCWGELPGAIKGGYMVVIGWGRRVVALMGAVEMKEEGELDG